MTQNDVWTIGRLLGWTTDFLRGRGAASPRLDAEVLLAHSLGWPRIQLYTSFADEPSEAIRSTFRELVRRRAEGTPVAYLVGWREFYSLRFAVTPDVLIPRPETEHLVVRLLDLLSKDDERSEPPLVADVGAGSGIIAICAAKHHANCRVIAVDISPAALKIARQNAQTHGVEARIEFVQGDLLEAVPATAEFDIVASNPPYVSSAEFERLSSEVRGQEPRSSLEAGPRGTEVIERLVPQAAERLRAGGWFLCEISPMISAAAMQILASEPRLEPGPIIHDLAGHPRIVQARKKA